MSTTSAEADGICLENGKPISELKVVELRKELETRNLPKSGNKKELHERLRNHLVSTGEANPVGSPGRQSSSSPVKSPEPVENPMIAKYRASQEQALRAAREEAEHSRAISAEGDVNEVEEQKRRRTESETTSSSKKSATDEKDESTEMPEPTVADTAVPENKVSEAKVEERVSPVGEEEEQGDAHSDSGGESTKSFIEETETGDKKAEEEVQKPEPTQPEEVQKPEPTQPEEVPEPEPTQPEEVQTPEPIQTEVAKPADNDSSSSDGEGEADKKEEPSSSSSSPATPPKQDKEMDGAIGAPISVDVESVVLDTQVELDYEEEEEDSESKQNSTTTTDKPAVTPGQVSTEGVVKVDEAKDSGESKSKNGSPKAEATENMTPEGFVRRRAASPARNPPSQLIHIRGLKRPFTVKALQNLLGNFGKLVDDGFWIDSIKSNCIVKFETEEQAHLARERLHNVVWPASSDLSLIVEFSTDEKLKRRRDEGKTEPVLPAAGLGLTVTVENTVSKWKDVDAPPRKSSQDLAKISLNVKKGEEKRERAKSPSRKRKTVAEPAEPQKTLEDIFKKTNAQPCVYYLPLTDEEAEKRAEKKQKERETAAATKSARNGSERDRERLERDNRRRSSPAQQSAASRQRSPDRKRDRRDSPPRGFRRH